jgi:hypothetical protein
LETTTRNAKNEKITKLDPGRLKNNKSRDPQGFINEIFKPGVIGNNLKKGILLLVNGVKDNFHFPFFMQWANITTIYKSKGSRLCLDSDRGIFVINILKKNNLHSDL